MNHLSKYFLLVSIFILWFYLPHWQVNSDLTGSSGLNLTVTIISPTQTVSPTPTPTGGSGGGGGGGSSGGSSDSFSDVIFRGIAYPGSQVVLVKDGQIVARSTAGPDAAFEIRLSGLGGGAYTFSVWSEDNNGTKSESQTFSQWITKGVTTVISGIFLPPTITADKTEVRKGDPITFIGQSAPTATIDLIFHSETEVIKKTFSDKYGNWAYKLDTLVFEYGDHEGRARAKKNLDLTMLSSAVIFKVGDQNIIREKTEKTLWKIGDLNKDGRVNLVDFSIEVYWYHKFGFPIDYDLNRDGKINIADFSIIAYNWTG